MKRRKIIIALIIFIIIFLLFSCRKDEPITEFSSENWQSVERNQRYHMLDDLYVKVELIGMTAEQVEQLLGEYSIRFGAEWVDMGKTDYHWAYWVRDDSWNGPEYLLISFKDDIVVSYELEYGWELF